MSNIESTVNKFQAANKRVKSLSAQYEQRQQEQLQNYYQHYEKGQQDKHKKINEKQKKCKKYMELVYTVNKEVRNVFIFSVETKT